MADKADELVVMGGVGTAMGEMVLDSEDGADVAGVLGSGTGVGATGACDIKSSVGSIALFERLPMRAEKAAGKRLLRNS
ncbi:hypothetical protein CYLTODRAFT_427654, partial [Cylindrobasidium torrendii FP15055 ss-10]